VLCNRLKGVGYRFEKLEIRCGYKTPLLYVISFSSSGVINLGSYARRCSGSCIYMNAESPRKWKEKKGMPLTPVSKLSKRHVVLPALYDFISVALWVTSQSTLSLALDPDLLFYYYRVFAFWGN
jgi:hypothetical protein